MEANAVRAGLVERAAAWRWRGTAAPARAAVPLSAWPVDRPTNWSALVNRASEIPDRGEIRNLRGGWLGAWSLLLIPYEQVQNHVRRSLAEHNLINPDGTVPEAPSNELVNDVLTRRQSVYWVRLALSWADASGPCLRYRLNPGLIWAAGSSSLPNDLRDQAARFVRRIETIENRV